MGCPGLRDPPHPNCAPTAEGARFALALHGSVSGRRWNTMAGQLMHFPTDLPSSVFVNLNVSYTDLARNVMRPSGGRHLFDTFMHSTVQSSEARSKLLELYQPVASLFYSNYQEGESSCGLGLGLGLGARVRVMAHRCLLQSGRAESSPL